MVKKLRPKKCKECGNKFTPPLSRPLQPVCSPKCGYFYAMKQKQKREKKQRQEKKKELLTISQLKKKLELHINEIIRRIDHETPCMMCGNNINKMFACHYHSVGSNDSLRFNLLNIWGGCYSCNGNKGGNITGYDEHLISSYSKEEWEYIKFDLVRDYSLIKMSREEVIEKTKLCSALKKTIPYQKRDLKSRWELRQKLNKAIGIYPQ